MAAITGRIFSTEEFSTFDGPGIRMTFFLKGCPLRCEWCHNPEGQSFGPEIVRSPNGCLHCGACMRAGEKKTGRPCLTEDSIRVCPRGLVRKSGRDVTPEELAAAVVKNVKVLNASGGGVTFSGGEPLAQPEFLLECLKLLRGVTDRAVQTSGYAPADVFARVLEECDYMLYDLKLMDGAQHLRRTGAGNGVILENFRTLAASGIEFCARMPLIPGVSDTPENIGATAEFLRENGVKRMELLPYNKMAGAKYAMTGREYRPDFDAAAEPHPHPEIFGKYGIEVMVL